MSYDSDLKLGLTIAAIIVVGCFFMWGAFTGRVHENDRIYNGCVELNADMKHSEIGRAHV